MKKYINYLLFLLVILGIIYFSLNSFLLINILNINLRSVYDFIYDWQQLIGAFLGALTPIALFLINEKYQKKQKKKAHLLLLEKSIILAINNLSDIDNMLHRFNSNQLTVAKQRIANESLKNQYSVGQIFIPLTATFSFSDELMNETTDSNYIENLKMDVYATSKELPILLQDLNRQFDRNINLNTQISIAKLNDPKMQNTVFLSNITDFEKYLYAEVFGHNIPVYLRKLVTLLIALKKMNSLGLKKWRATFPFKQPYTQEIDEKISAYFSEEINNKIKELDKSFKSKLLLVEEKSSIV